MSKYEHWGKRHLEMKCFELEEILEGTVASMNGWAAKYAELRVKCKRYEDALREIAKMHMAVEMWELAQEALEQSDE